MTHQSENVRRLKVSTFTLEKISELPTPDLFSPEVWFFVLPAGRGMKECAASDQWYESLLKFSENLHVDSIMAFLTSPEDAAETWTALRTSMQYQLLISVKLDKPLILGPGQLSLQHTEVLVLSKYRASLKHTRTRQAYTFCPACDKTTKDYGGKKHLYHEYGTALSDVWRDITYTWGEEPTEIIDRLRDLFGLDPYRDLEVIDLSGVQALATSEKSTASSVEHGPVSKAKVESQLIVGDVMESLRKLPDNSVEFCFSDPPYNLAKRYDTWDDSLNAEEYLTWCDEWIDELARVLKPGCTVAILNIPVLAIRHFEHMKNELVFQNWITWDGLSLPVRNIMPANYSIVCFSKGEPRPLPGLANGNPSEIEALALTTQRENFCVRASCISSRPGKGIKDREPVGDLWWDTHRLKHNSRRVDHPCQLPPSLMRRLIALYSSQDEVVLDPFNGAGTTTLCAAEMGRRFIGIELSEKYHQITEERHRSLANGEDPFGKVNGVPKAKNSRVSRVASVKYEVPKRTLQLEVKRVAEVLGHVPNRSELEELGQYPIHLYDEYFTSWADACAAAKTTGMSELRSTEVS